MGSFRLDVWSVMGININKLNNMGKVREFAAMVAGCMIALIALVLSPILVLLITLGSKDTEYSEMWPE